jgi:hypothetical protein
MGIDELGIERAELRVDAKGQLLPRALARRTARERQDRVGQPGIFRCGKRRGERPTFRASVEVAFDPRAIGSSEAPIEEARRAPEKEFAAHGVPVWIEGSSR